MAYFSRATTRAIVRRLDRKSTRLNSSHGSISYAVFCLKKKKNHTKEVIRNVISKSLPTTLNTSYNDLSHSTRYITRDGIDIEKITTTLNSRHSTTPSNA